MGDCKVYAICNQKGGVGKTSVSVSLATAFSQMGYKVLLIDSDPQASATVSLGETNPDELDFTLATVIDTYINDGKVPYYEGILEHEEGVDFMPCNIELSGVENSLMNVMSREKILKTYVDQERRYYDFIFIDCMPSLGMMTINALSAADSVIIPTQANYLSSKGINLLLQSVSKVKRFINPDLQIAGILLTMVDGRTNNAKMIEEALRNGIGTRINVFQTMIPFSVRAAECPNEGVSIFKHDPDGKVAEAYRNLTEEVMSLGREEKDRSRDYGFR